MRGHLRLSKPDTATAVRLLIAAFVILFIGLLLFWRLGSLTPGLSPAEYSARQASHDTEHIIRNGINAPYFLLLHGYVNLLGDSFTALRLAGVTAAVIIMMFLFVMLRSLFGMTIGLFALLIISATPWAVLAARSAAPYIMLLWLVVPVACFVMMNRAKRRPELWWLLLCAAAALSLYTPGLIWFVAGAAIFAGRRLRSIPDRISGTFAVIGITMALLLLIPLAVSLAIEPGRIRNLLLLPANWPGLIELLRSFGWALLGLLWGIRNHIDIGIGRLPLFNFLQLALMVFGFYALGSRMRPVSLALGSWLLLSAILTGINNNAHYLLLGLPAAAVLIAAGLRLLYIEWRRVFPLNPFSYALAITLITLVVGAHLLYTARYSLSAWPRTPETKAAYVLK